MTKPTKKELKQYYKVHYAKYGKTEKRRKYAREWMRKQRAKLKQLHEKTK